MASTRSSVIQLDDGQDAQSELRFQDFTLGENSDVATLSPSGSYSPYKESLDSPGDENEDLLGEERKTGSSFWKFSYYQSFFDVDTDQVVQRVLWSMIPLNGRATFLDRQIRPKPDLYGPFWIAATLVFSTAISANIANYLTSEGQSSRTWTYDFHKVSLAATAIYSYIFLLPIILWGLMWYRQSSNRYTLLEILCVYGYSLAIYVPISVLWVIQVPWFQWILVIVGASLSGVVLIQTFWPIFKDDNKKIAAVVLCLILLFHTLLAVGFVTYFFRPPHEGGKGVVPSNVNVVSTSSTSTTATSQKDEISTNDVDKQLKSLSLLDQTTNSENKKKNKRFNAIPETQNEERNASKPDQNVYTQKVLDIAHSNIVTSRSY